MAIDVFIFVWIVNLRLIAFAHFENVVIGQYGSVLTGEGAIRGWHDYTLANQNASLPGKHGLCNGVAVNTNNGSMEWNGV